MSSAARLPGCLWLLLSACLVALPVILQLERLGIVSSTAKHSMTSVTTHSDTVRDKLSDQIIVLSANGENTRDNVIDDASRPCVDIGSDTCRMSGAMFVPPGSSMRRRIRHRDSTVANTLSSKPLVVHRLTDNTIEKPVLVSSPLSPEVPEECSASDSNLWRNDADDSLNEKEKGSSDQAHSLLDAVAVDPPPTASVSGHTSELGTEIDDATSSCSHTSPVSSPKSTRVHDTHLRDELLFPEYADDGVNAQESGFTTDRAPRLGTDTKRPRARSTDPNENPEPEQVQSEPTHGLFHTIYSFALFLTQFLSPRRLLLALHRFIVRHSGLSPQHAWWVVAAILAMVAVAVVACICVVLIVAFATGCVGFLVLGATLMFAAVAATVTAVVVWSILSFGALVALTVAGTVLACGATIEAWKFAYRLLGSVEKVGLTFASPTVVGAGP